MIAFWT